MSEIKIHTSIDDFSAVEVKMNLLLEQAKYEEYFNLYINTFRTFHQFLHNSKFFKSFIELSIQVLEVETTYINDKVLRSRVFNCIASFCRHNGYFETAINYYLLYHLSQDKTRKFIYYNNLANTLAESHNFELALHYFNEAQNECTISKTNFSEDKIKQIQFYLLLNKLQCTITFGKTDEAINTFKETDFSNFESKENSNYSFVKLFVEIFSKNKNEVKLTDFLDAKCTYLLNNHYKPLIDINNFILENLHLQDYEIEELLLENFSHSKKLESNNILRASVLKIIDYYDNKGNSTKANEFLRICHKLEKSKSKAITVKLMKIYLEEFSKLV